MLIPGQQFVQNFAIKEKTELLKKLKYGQLNQEQVIKIIQDRRVDWIKNNIHRLKPLHNDLSLPLIAHRIIFLDHMLIFPADSIVMEISDKFIIIRSHNFCPYLEACKLLNLDTRWVCKNICEKPIDEMIKYIHPQLKFWRNYNHIRPYQEYCEEYIGLVD